MMKLQSLKIQRFSLSRALYLLFFSLFFCLNLWASQEAMVLVNKAVIYSDKEMLSPIGYISRGKKIVVGEIARNRAQVYPIIVSGKIAYIRVNDVTTEKESIDAPRLVAERFQKNVEATLRSKVTLSYFAYSAQISLKEMNGSILDKDALTWNGVSLKGEVLVKNSFDVQILTNYMTTSQDKETFRVVEFGLGGGYRLINHRKFTMKLEAQALAVPFSSYSVGDDFRVKSYGYTVGAGINLTYLFDSHWGLDANAGVYQTKLSSFKAPTPYKEISPTFTGNRFGVGVSYTY